MYAIECMNIRKSYNPGLFKKQVLAVNDLSFSVVEGEVFGLIGPNGAGKSTTIRMLLGLSRPDEGQIVFRGQSLSKIENREDLGYLPENPYLYDHLTLLELLDFCGKSSGLSHAVGKLRGFDLMDRLGLLNAQKRPLRTFSKGMLQRAGLCFALLHDPAIVVLDEPMSGLDPIGRKMVFDLVMDLKAAGKTIFFCSHILNDVERLCDRIGLMNNGQLIKQFEKKDFMNNDGKMVFLETQFLTPAQAEQIKTFGGMVREEHGGHLVALPADQYFTINDYIESAGVGVRGCRSEWVSLEDMFMQAVKEFEQ